MNHRQPTPMIFSARILLLGLSIISAPTVAKAEPLVTIEAGDLPIILSAPHGGREAIPGVSPRKGIGVRSFNSRKDIGTAQMTERLADEIEKKFGKRPYVVIARFHRKFLDVNRPPRLAYKANRTEAAEIYEAYHAAIAEARSDVARRWGRGILFDVHGQAAAPNGIFRGTQNGQTTTHLLERFGREALVGEHSVFGHLAAQGMQVIPEIGSGKRETRYQGGHTVVTYGSGPGGSVDAIQLELGRELRSSDADTAKQLALAIAAFAEEHLPKTEKEAEDAKQIRVGVYHDLGAGRSVNELMRALAKFDGIEVTKLMATDICSGRLAKVDVLIQPGGSGGKQGRHLGAAGREAIRSFLREGGGYIGICAGAYLASADYEWSLDVLDAKVLDRKHWARGNGTVQIKLSESGKRILETDKGQLAIHYAQGPLLAPADDPEIPDYDPVATFQTEIAKNGAPEGVMKGTTAIAQGQFGRGRVICFSPHPEMTEGIEAFVHRAIEHVAEDSPRAQTLHDE
ncbi:MAG: N-formylglutamate amidohydrolase/glutamine amidotransferase-like uncharacterized protein [Verrucomicrobiales bacterium]|jgi:N-formylglutamate amidohydrolase/glutamine amidotransferase-like uncharacterized protein